MQMCTYNRNNRTIIRKYHIQKPLGSQQNNQVIDAEIIRAAVDNQGLY
jgi:hypothetical protein